MPPELTKRLNYRDFALFPDDGRRHELIDGKHLVTPSPTTAHQRVSIWLQYQLFQQIALAGRGEVFDAPIDVQLSDFDIVEPDLVIVLRARRQIISPSRIMGAPDLVVEIVSPASRTTDFGRKRELYRSSGVGEYWIVQPDERVLTQYVLEDEKYRLQGPHDESVVAATIPDLSVDLVRVWQQLD